MALKLKVDVSGQMAVVTSFPAEMGATMARVAEQVDRIAQGLQQHERLLTALDHQLTFIVTQLRALDAQGRVELMALADIQAASNDLVTSVEAETDLDTSILAVLNANTATLTDLQTRLAAAIAENDPVAMQAVVDQMRATIATNEANKARLAAAIVTGTPAE